MSILRVILGDQLSSTISSLKDCDKTHDTILMCEVYDEATYVKHHKKKIAFLFSAMRHFGEALQAHGYQLHYTKLDDPENGGSFTAEVERRLKSNHFERIVITHPGEYRVLKAIQTWEEAFGIPVDILPDQRFLCTLDDFNHWAKDRKQLRMEFFYRDMRKRYAILMDGEEPIGGKWNYDAFNRKPAKSGLSIPAPCTHPVDEISREVISLVANRFKNHFGDLEPFYFAVTRKQALAVLKTFIEKRLIHFGDYQDAMIENEPWMYHSHISFYLNCGLLLPLECVKAAEKAYHTGQVPLNAAEGFIRQIIGWREYVRGIYWLKMPDYETVNFFDAKRTLPNFYWTANTQMNCLRQCISDTRTYAYAHHIQRLMVLGNFALLAGIDPRFVNEWYLIVYADAYEWVEMPNVSGMILFADGGYLASKPYAAGGSYINKMSDYCKNCQYSVHQKQGEKACPFNYLYWHFLVQHRDKLEHNQRLRMMYKTYDRLSDEKKKTIQKDSEIFLNAL